MFLGLFCVRKGESMPSTPCTLCVKFSATYIQRQYNQGQGECSSSSSMTVAVIENYQDNISTIQEGHCSTERAILFIQKSENESEDPY